jgi:type I restriction enzyme S subunit
MNEWKLKNLGELLGSKGYIRGPFGSSLKRGEMKDSGIPVYEQVHAIHNIREFRFFIDEIKFKELERFQVKNADLIISCSGTVGKISIINENDPKGIISQALLILRPDIRNVRPVYLKYFLTSELGQYHLLSASHGSVQPNIAERKIVQQIPIDLPTVEEQDKIIEILSSLDYKIDLLNRNNKTLEELGEALFRQWFIEKVEDTWEEKSLIQLAEYLNGLALQKFPAENGKPSLPAIKIREMNQGITEATDRVSFNLPPKYIIDNGDILFSWSGSLDVIIWTGGKGALNQHLFKVSSNLYPKWLIYYATRLFLPEFRDIANDKATTMGHIQRGHLTKAILKLPSIEIINKYDEIISAPFNKIIQNQLQIQQLKTLRDTLLPKLMSGVVRVEN